MDASSVPRGACDSALERPNVRMNENIGSGTPEVCGALRSAR